MPSADIELTVDGQIEDARSVMCHHQSDPYPGGHHYRLAVHDPDVVEAAKKNLGIGVNLKFSEIESRLFLSLLYSHISLKLGRDLPFRYWLNTIDQFDVAENGIVLQGICSRHLADKNNLS
jgi:hypothetical protein